MDQAFFMVLGALGGLCFLATRTPRQITYAYIVATYLTPAFDVLGVPVSVADGVGLAAVFMLMVRFRKIQCGRHFLLLAAGPILSLIVLILTQESYAGESTLRAVRLLLVIAVGLLFSTEDAQPREIARIIDVIVLAAAIGSVVAVAVFFSGVSPPWPYAEQFIFVSGAPRLRAQGFVGESSSLANQMLLALCLLVFFSLRSPYKWSRTLAYCSVLPILICIGLTFTRTAYLGVAVMLTVAIVRSGWAARLLAGSCVFLAVTQFGRFPRFIQEALFFRLDQTFSASSTTELTSGRLAAWSRLLAEERDLFDVIFGSGFKSVSNLPGLQLYADNAYLSAYYETGLIGLLCVVLAIIINVRVLHRRCSDGDGAGVSNLRLALTVWLLLQVLSGLTGDIFTFSRTLGPWVIAFAAFWSLRRQAPVPGEVLFRLSDGRIRG